MGAVNRYTVSAGHGAFEHAAELVALLRRVEPRAPAEGSLAEVERLLRLQWATESRVLLMGMENEALRDQLQAERANIEEERGRIRDHWDAVEDFKRSRRYRLARLVGKPLDLVRRRAD
jgi:hypothetical protein